MCGWQDVGMVIRESSVVSFLHCLVTFLRFHPYMLFHFFLKTIVVTLGPTFFMAVC